MSKQEIKIGSRVAPTNEGEDVKTGRTIRWNLCRGMVVSHPVELQPGVMFVQVKWYNRAAVDMRPSSWYELKLLEAIS